MLLNYIKVSVFVFLSMLYCTGTALGQDDLASYYSDYDDASDLRIDYEAFDYVLSQIIYPVGPSDRRSSRRVQEPTGTLIARQNKSRYRLEGNRVIFHLMKEEHKDYITAYRQELEALPSTVNLATLSSNEQLAYWLNLYNIVLLDEVSKAYPVNKPLERIRINEVQLLDAPIVNLPDRTLTLNQIRYEIVIPIWADPRVMYGFYTFTVGGPSIQKTAFSGGAVWKKLDRIGFEFVNALRGVDLYKNPVKISNLYYENNTLFPNGDSDIRRHMRRYANEVVLDLIDNGNKFVPAKFDNKIADLTNGTRCGYISGSPIEYRSTHSQIIGKNGTCPAVPPMTREFINKIQQRRLRLFREGKMGEVIIRDVETQDSDDTPNSR